MLSRQRSKIAWQNELFWTTHKQVWLGQKSFLDNISRYFICSRKYQWHTSCLGDNAESNPTLGDEEAHKNCKTLSVPPCNCYSAAQLTFLLSETINDKTDIVVMQCDFVANVSGHYWLGTPSRGLHTVDRHWVPNMVSCINFEAGQCLVHWSYIRRSLEQLRSHNGSDRLYPYAERAMISTIRKLQGPGTALSLCPIQCITIKF